MYTVTLLLLYTTASTTTYHTNRNINHYVPLRTTTYYKLQNEYMRSYVSLNVLFAT